MQQETSKTKKATTTVVKAAPPVTAPVVKETQLPAIATDFEAGGWDTEKIDTKDIIIPKILLMHGTSDLVKKGTRNQGEIIKSTSGDVVAKRNETVDVLVFERWKEWRVMKKNPTTGRFEYVRLDTWTPENDNLPWEYTEGEDSFRRDKTMNFYGVIASEAAEGKAFPVKLSFVRTSFKVGMKIADAYARALMDKQPPTRQIFKVGSELVTGKEETFFAFTAAEGPASTEAMRAAALTWRQVVMQAKKTNTLVDHEVDDVEVKQEASTDEF